MNVNISEQEGLKREIEITLSLEELQPHFDKAFQAAQQEAQIEGFRKGKVPMNVIKARFGKSIERDALGDIADESFRKAVEENNLEVAGAPMLVEMKRTDDGGGFFKIAYEVYPTITLREYHEIEIEKSTREISDDDVEKELENIRLRTSKLEPAEQVTDTMHVVKLKFSDIDASTGMPLLGGKEREVFLESEETDAILRNDVLNLKKGDSFRYTEEHAAGEHGDHAHTHDYHVTVTDIQKVVKSELNQEYIQQISSGVLNTEEELRADIKRSLQQYWDKEVSEALRDQVITKFIQLHEFDIPESLVVLTAQDMIEDAKKRHPDDQYLKRAKNEELFNMFMAPAEQSVRWQLIASEIVAKEEITIGEEDLDKVASQIGIEKEQVRVAVEKNPQLRNRMTNDRLFDFLMSRIVVTERPYDDMLDEIEVVDDNEDNQ